MDDLITAEQLSYLIGLIYDCATDPARWPLAMEAMRLALGLHNSSLDLLALPGGESLFNYTTNMSELWATRMLEYGPHAVEMWGGPAVMAALPFTEPAVLSRVAGMPDDSWTTPLYLKWARPQGICDVLAVFLARDQRSFGALGFGRHRDAPPVDDRMIDLARLLAPHAQRSAAINRLLDIAALRDATFGALFDTLDAPVLVVGADLNIVHANRAGRALLDREGALRSRGGTLTMADRGVHRALDAAIRDATGDIAAIGRKGIGIPLRNVDGEAGALHVLPLRPDHSGGRRLAAVFIAGAGAAPAAGSVVGALFGLTPAECAVFEHIAAGRDVPRAADALGIARSTVRTHLQHIYDKTGIRRQAELVKLSNSLAAPAAG